MATIKEMSQEYLQEIYELSIFLRMHGHSSLGERILTAASEIATLSHVSWTTVTNDAFIANLVKTHEFAEKLNGFIGIVNYLDLGYDEMKKITEDTEAIYKMSRSSLNTVFSKFGLKEQKKYESPSLSNLPSKKLADQYVGKNNALKQELAQQGNDTVPQEVSEELPQEESDNLPFDIAENEDDADAGGDQAECKSA